MVHVDSFRINIDIASMHRLTARILDVSNAYQNANVTIHERFCVSSPPYYIYCFEISYPNVTINRDDGPFFLQFMNGIQGTKPVRRQCNRLLDALVKILKYKTCSSPRRAVRSNSLVCSKNSLLIVGIGPILNKEIELIFRSDCSDCMCVYS